MMTAEQLDVLTQETIAMAAPTILEAAGFEAGTPGAPHPADVAALIMSQGITLKGRTDVDELGLAEALVRATAARDAGEHVHAASGLIMVALRARELGDAPVLSAAWSRALAWLS